MDYQLQQPVQNTESRRLSWFYVFMIPIFSYIFSLIVSVLVQQWINGTDWEGGFRTMAMTAIYATVLLPVALGFFVYLIILRAKNSTSFIVRNARRVFTVLITGCVLYFIVMIVIKPFFDHYRSRAFHLTEATSSQNYYKDIIGNCTEHSGYWESWSACVHMRLKAPADYTKCLTQKPRKIGLSSVWNTITGRTDSAHASSDDIRQACDDARTKNIANGSYNSSLEVSSCFDAGWPSDSSEMGRFETCLGRFVIDQASSEKCVSQASDTYAQVPVNSSPYELWFIQDLCKRKLDSFNKYELPL